MTEKFDVFAFGFVADGRIMDNLERRFRLRAPDGSAYIRTEVNDDQPGGWQNAHHHKGVRETYIVQKGWIVAVEAHLLRTVVHVYWPGNIFTAEPGVDHNVYMPRGAVIHTVQHGTPVGNPEKNGNDWYPATEAFDRSTKALSVVDMLRYAGVTEARIKELAASA